MYLQSFSGSQTTVQPFRGGQVTGVHVQVARVGVADHLLARPSAGRRRPCTRTPSRSGLQTQFFSHLSFGVQTTGVHSQSRSRGRRRSPSRTCPSAVQTTGVHSHLPVSGLQTQSFSHLSFGGQTTGCALALAGLGVADAVLLALVLRRADDRRALALAGFRVADAVLLALVLRLADHRLALALAGFRVADAVLLALVLRLADDGVLALAGFGLQTQSFSHGFGLQTTGVHLHLPVSGLQTQSFSHAFVGLQTTGCALALAGLRVADAVLLALFFGLQTTGVHSHLPVSGLQTQSFSHAFFGVQTTGCALALLLRVADAVLLALVLRLALDRLALALASRRIADAVLLARVLRRALFVWAQLRLADRNRIALLELLVAHHALGGLADASRRAAIALDLDAALLDAGAELAGVLDPGLRRALLRTEVVRTRTPAHRLSRWRR